MNGRSNAFTVRLVAVLLAGGCVPESMPPASNEGAESSSTSDVEPGGESAPNGMGFVPPPDVGAGVFECSIWVQDCPTGQKCMPWAKDGGSAWSSTRCSPIVAEPVGIGESCQVEGSGLSGLDDCDLASMCWDVDRETNLGTCVPMCVDGPENPRCEDPNNHCVQAAGAVLNICFPTCNPLLQDCREGLGCYATPDSFICAPTASSNGINEACEFYSVCAPGLQCIALDGPPCLDDATACCRPFCRLDDEESSCSAVEECVPWFDAGDAPARWEDVGFCAFPDL